MQQGKTFKTYSEAKNFCNFHKHSWIHTLWEGGGGTGILKHIAGYHVVFLKD